MTHRFHFNDFLVSSLTLPFKDFPLRLELRDTFVVDEDDGQCRPKAQHSIAAVCISHF